MPQNGPPAAANCLTWRGEFRGTEKETNHPPEETLLRVPSILVLAALLGPCLQSAPSFGQAKPGIERLFGDRGVTIVATPGHTPGHRSLLISLPKTGAILLPGDAVHFKDRRDNRLVPENNNDKDKSAASLLRVADLLAKKKARLRINHDKAQRDSQRMAPAFYD
jgi:glyoxylase-like metal-dependent hydrolase (beta-lactamase superfamily II)